MKRILHVISSIQGNQSYSTKLSQAIIQKINDKYPESVVEEVNLNEINIPHLTPPVLQAMFTPEDQLSAEAKEALRYSNEAVQQLLASDIIVIGAPLYNFTIPSTLKSWIDHITRAGLTFGYGEHGPIGMVNDKKVYIAMASGGIYTEGPGKENDFVAPYLKSFLSFLGMTDSTVFRAEGLKVAGIKELGLQKGIERIVID